MQARADRHPTVKATARRSPGLLAGAALLVVLGGCAAIPGTGNAGAVRDQADAALARWADAVAAAGGPPRVVVVGELTGQIGDWEVAVGGNNKQALYAGLVEGDDLVPGDVPPDGDVEWPDGTTTTIPLLSARDAVAAIRSGATATCDDCTAMQITAAVLSSGPVETTHGPAIVPIWEFSIEGTAVKVSRVAIADPVIVVPPPWDPNHPPVGLRIDSASATVDGLELTVQFVGAPLPGDKPCGEDYTAEAVESDLAVAVIVTTHAHVTLGGCSAVGAIRTAVAPLAAPLGDRAVLETQEGLPVPVRLLP